MRIVARNLCVFPYRLVLTVSECGVMTGRWQKGELSMADSAGDGRASMVVAFDIQTNYHDRG
ncbi:MAG: hypothetical protein P4L99_06995, partial [Chthoniobacter sp.]|nr:hypothetical protein [Chthoniobacter sp.]